MGESTAYGTSLGCVSRRQYLLGVFSFLTTLCWIQIGFWIFRSRIWDILSGNKIAEVHPPDCTGSACFEVFSCYGMKSTTLNIREPLMSLTGAAIFPIGVIGAHHGYRWHLRFVAFYLIAVVAVRSGLIIGDLAYSDTCQMYSMNIIEETMINWFPPPPVTNGAQGVLRSWAEYPFAAVAKLTNNFPVYQWYLGWTVAGLVFFAYTANESRLLSRLAERGPLGFGPCYGLGQWDQVIDPDALALIKGKDLRSKFVEDCTVLDNAFNWPLAQGALPYNSFDETVPIRKLGGAGYGAVRQAFLPAGAGEAPLYLQPTAEEQEEQGFSPEEEAAAAAAAAAEEERRAVGISIAQVSAALPEGCRWEREAL